MPTIDPDSPRDEGIDCAGKAVELGDTDSMDHFVGYIDEEGTCWESERERDVSLTVGRFTEAWSEWNRAGGLLGEKPDARRIAEQVCRNVDSIEEAVRDAESWVDPEDTFTQMIWAAQRKYKARMASLN